MTCLFNGQMRAIVWRISKISALLPARHTGIRRYPNQSLDDREISVSFATLQLKPAGEGRTTLKVTEQRCTRAWIGAGAGSVRSVGRGRRLSREDNVFGKQWPSACNQFLHRTLPAEARHLNAAGRNSRVASNLADRVGREEEPVIRIYHFAVGEYAFDIPGTERIRNCNNNVANIAFIGTQKRL